MEKLGCELEEESWEARDLTGVTGVIEGCGGLENIALLGLKGW